MPFARRTALVLVVLLLAAVGTTAAASSRSAAEADRSAHGGGVALTAQHEGLQGSAVRLERDNRREPPASQRSLKHLLAFAVLVAAAIAGVGTGTGVRRLVLASFRPPLTTWWFRSGGRAPPRLQPSFI